MLWAQVKKTQHGTFLFVKWIMLQVVNFSEKVHLLRNWKGKDLGIGIKWGETLSLKGPRGSRHLPWEFAGALGWAPWWVCASRVAASRSRREQVSGARERAGPAGLWAAWGRASARDAEHLARENQQSRREQTVIINTLFTTNKSREIWILPQNNTRTLPKQDT